MALQITDVTAALKKVIMPYIRDNVPTQTIFLDQVKRNAEVTYMNDNFYAPIRSGKNGGVHSLANDGSTTRTGKSTYAQASVGVKILTGTFDISKLTIDATKSDRGAVENMLTNQAKSLTSDFAKVINRQAFSDGYGVVGMVNATGTTNVAVSLPGTALSDGRSIDWYGTVNNDISPIEYLAAGQILGLGSAGARLGTVSSVSYDGTSGVGTVTFTGAAIGTANEPIYIVDGAGAGAGTSEMQGVRLALSSSTGTSLYAGLPRSTAAWTPQLDATSEALSLTRMESLYLRAKKFAQTGDRYAIFVNITLYKKYGDLLTALRRTVNETDLLGGWTGLEFAAGAGRVGVFLDYDVPDGECLILNLDTWTIAQVDDMDWMESPNEGSMLRIANSITYQATMVWFANFLNVAPAANARLLRKTG